MSPEEIENAEILIIREAQQAAFTEEYRALQENKLISKKSRLKTLVPLLDEDGLIRCDGRLRFAEFLPYDMRFPIILPRGSWTTKLVVKHFHEPGHHVSGTNHILANLSTKYWIQQHEKKFASGKMTATNVRDEKQESINRSWHHCPLSDCGFADCGFVGFATSSFCSSLS